MDIHTATEVAYKNGYEQGKKDAVKHGKWCGRERDCRRYTLYFECSNCHCITIYPYAVKDIDYEYCPYCGAKMDGKDEE